MAFIKNLLGIERLDKIIVPQTFKEHPPRRRKLNERMFYYEMYGKLPVPIVITDRNNLIDGYTSYLIAKENNKKYVKVVRV